MVSLMEFIMTLEEILCREILFPADGMLPRLCLSHEQEVLNIQ